MDEDGALTNVTSGPVGSTVALPLGESNKSRPVSGGVWEAMDGKYATHFLSVNVGSNRALTGNLKISSPCRVTPRLFAIR